MHFTAALALIDQLQQFTPTNHQLQELYDFLFSTQAEIERWRDQPIANERRVDELQDELDNKTDIVSHLEVLEVSSKDYVTELQQTVATLLADKQQLEEMNRELIRSLSETRLDRDHLRERHAERDELIRLQQTEIEGLTDEIAGLNRNLDGILSRLAAVYPGPR